MIVPRHEQRRAEVAAHYDDLDPYYRGIWGEHIHHGLWLAGNETPERAVEQLAMHVAELGEIGRGTSVCDLGAGYGATARLLARWLGARVTALTVSRAQYEYAISRPRDDGGAPTYLLRDWLENHLPSESFDTVIAIESTEHIADKDRLFSEVHRVLRPGGRLVLCSWLASGSPSPWQARHLLEPICEEGRLPCLLTAEETKEAVIASGLGLERYEDLSRAVDKTWALCALGFVKGVIAHKEYRDFMLHGGESRIFAKTVFRIWAAYATRAMQYATFTARKPSEPTAAWKRAS